MKNKTCSFAEKKEAKDMGRVGWSDTVTLDSRFIDEIESLGNYKGLESIFETENNLLQYVYRLNQESAQREGKKLVKDLSSVAFTNKLREYRCYFVSLSAIVTRYLAEHYFTASQAFAFQTTCCGLIYEKLTEDNLEVIAMELIELYTYVLTDRKSPEFMHDTVNKVLQYIDEEVESAITVEQIAKKFDVSTSHLSRIFKQHVGVTLVEYINIRKVEEAQYYLRFSSKRISDISNQFYFCNQSYFTRIFKKYTGETPRRFRNHLAGEYFHYSLKGKESASVDGQ